MILFYCNFYETIIYIYNYRLSEIHNKLSLSHFLSQIKYEKARTIVRIKVNLICAALVFLGCIYYVYAGKRAAARGETMATRNIQRHKEMNEAYRLEQERNNKE